MVGSSQNEGSSPLILANTSDPADMALGHEGAGVVEDLGPDTKHLKKGDRVGWGYIHDSCSHCQQCLSGRETYCAERAFYGYADLDQGSMGQWVFPEALHAPEV